jgi:hypothetical protein
VDVKARIIELLEIDKHSFAELAEYLDMSEDVLSDQLNQKTLELRKLETISKVLRVPLYSFFHIAGSDPHAGEKPYYIHRLWTDDDGSKSVRQLEREIEMLREVLREKEEKVRKLRR